MNDSLMLSSWKLTNKWQNRPLKLVTLNLVFGWKSDLTKISGPLRTSIFKVLKTVKRKPSVCILGQWLQSAWSSDRHQVQRVGRVGWRASEGRWGTCRTGPRSTQSRHPCAAGHALGRGTQGRPGQKVRAYNTSTTFAICQTTSLLSFFIVSRVLQNFRNVSSSNSVESNQRSCSKLRQKSSCVQRTTLSQNQGFGHLKWKYWGSVKQFLREEVHLFGDDCQTQR